MRTADMNGHKGHKSAPLNFIVISKLFQKTSVTYIFVQKEIFILAMIAAQQTSRDECFIGAVGNQLRVISNFYPFTVRGNDFFLAESGQVICNINKADCQNIGNILLSQVNPVRCSGR